MKKLYDEFFYVPKHGRVREKVLLARITVTVAFIIMCLAGMSITAYAYFSSNVSSTLNSIHTANYSLKIENNGTALESDTFTCNGAQNDTYTFTLTPDGTAENGYCRIEVVSGEKTETCYTTQIFKTAGDNNDRITSLTLSVRAAVGSKIIFTPQWGTSVNYSVNQDKLYKNGDCIDVLGTVATVSSSNGNTVAAAESNIPDGESGKEQATDTAVIQEAPSAQATESTKTATPEDTSATQNEEVTAENPDTAAENEESVSQKAEIESAAEEQTEPEVQAESTQVQE